MSLHMWQGNQNRGHRQSSLYGMHKMSYHYILFKVLKNILWTIKSVNVQLHRYTGWPSSVQLLQNWPFLVSPHGSCICLTGGTSETAVLIGIHLLPWWQEVLQGWGPTALITDPIHLIPFCVAFNLAAMAFSRPFSCEAVALCWTWMLRINTAYWNERYKMRMFC